MDGLWWKTRLKLMIWGYHYFWKHPLETTSQLIVWCVCLLRFYNQASFWFWNSVIQVESLPTSPPKRKGSTRKQAFLGVSKKWIFKSQLLTSGSGNTSFTPHFPTYITPKCNYFAVEFHSFWAGLGMPYPLLILEYVGWNFIFGVTDRGRTGGLFRSSGTIFFALPFWFSAWWFFNQPKFEKY